MVCQDEKQPYHFAKVQLLDDCGICPKSKLPVVRLRENNAVVIVRLAEIGALSVIGAHPDEEENAISHYLLLPWPRRSPTDPDLSE